MHKYWCVNQSNAEWLGWCCDGHWAESEDSEKDSHEFSVGSNLQCNRYVGLFVTNFEQWFTMLLTGIVCDCEFTIHNLDTECEWESPPSDYRYSYCCRSVLSSWVLHHAMDGSSCHGSQLCLRGLQLPSPKVSMVGWISNYFYLWFSLMKIAIRQLVDKLYSINN